MKKIAKPVKFSEKPKKIRLWEVGYLDKNQFIHNICIEATDISRDKETIHFYFMDTKTGKIVTKGLVRDWIYAVDITEEDTDVNRDTDSNSGSHKAILPQGFGIVT